MPTSMDPSNGFFQAFKRKPPGAIQELFQEVQTRSEFRGENVWFELFGGKILGIFIPWMSRRKLGSIGSTPWSKYMAQSPKGGLIQGLYKPIHGNCAIYFYPGVNGL